MREELFFLRFDRPCRGTDTIEFSEDFLRNRYQYDSDARHLALTPLGDFVVYKGPDGGSEDRWFPTTEGLKTVQGLLNHYRGLIESGPASAYSRRALWDARLTRKIAPLEVVESLLLGADARGAGFFIAERD